MHDQIRDYIRAGFAGLYIVTFEDVRAEAELKALADELEYTLFNWTITRGILNTTSGTVENILDPIDAVNAVAELPEKSLLVLSDFHQFLGDRAQPASPLVTRSLKEQIRTARTAGKVIVVTGCTLNLPPELEKEFTVIDYTLPDAGALGVIADNILASAEITIDAEMKQHAIESAMGLTTQEAEDIMALSIVKTQTLGPELIAGEKARAVKKDGLLEIIEPSETADDIGGLDNLKSWLVKRRNAFTPAAVEFGLPMPKGTLILGIPGTGKSLTAKTAATILARPILKLDAGRLFAGIVGESEANFRRAIQTAEAIAPCILWVDEIEKGFSGVRSSGSSDGGTSARVFGSFLNWMQEKQSPVFVVATANDVSQLPPEFLRAGRFDQLWFVDLPDAREREAIWRIHLAKRQREPENYDITALAGATDKFTGAEIEQVVIEALFECFDCDTELNQAALMQAIDQTVPLAVTMSESVTRLRQWAKGRARPAGGNDRMRSRNGRRLAA